MCTGLYSLREFVLKLPSTNRRLANTNGSQPVLTRKMSALSVCSSGIETEAGQNCVLMVGSSPSDELTTFTVRIPILAAVDPSLTIIANVYSGAFS